jgi:16S rRNA (guanine527-N7)-methyltransferase
VLQQVFGPEADRARRYADLLVQEAVPYGLMGPREPAVLWTRHILNCAVVAELIPPAASIIDVGSGAGLPGIALALACPASPVVLVEPLLRRATWLSSTVAALGLDDQVTVVRGRIEEQRGRVVGQVVTSRAVAPLGRLVSWCRPAVSPGGVMLALRGEGAAAELLATELRSHGGTGEVLMCAGPSVAAPTRVVRIRFSRPASPVRFRPAGSRGARA